MPQHTDLNVSPYFDDFDPKKNYHRVLFKPGYPIQARELTTLQTIAQHQIESFGKHIFKEGSVVIPGQTRYDNPVPLVMIESQYNGAPISLYFDALVGKKLKGSVSGVTAEVVYVLTDTDSVKKRHTLYVRYYESGGAELKNKTFTNGETLQLATGVINYEGLTIRAGQGVCNTIPSGSTGNGTLFNVAAGVYFVRGFFVNVLKQTIILDQYTTTPSYRVGFDVIESIVTADEDESLYDNAQGFSNYAAPGADRFKIELELSKKPLSNQKIEDFVQIFQVENGKAQSYTKNTQYSLIRDELARRTYDQSGDFYVRPFSLFVRDCLNDRVLNKGMFFSDQKTMQNNTPAENLMVYEIGPGKAYVNGYDVETTSVRLLDVKKTRTTKTLKRQAIGYNAGLLCLVNNAKGSPAIGFANAAATVSLMDRRSGSSGITTIGVARVYDYSPETAYSDSTSRMELRLYDIQTYTRIYLSAPITLSTPAHIRGTKSGATGYLKDSITSSDVLNLYEVSGTFLENEYITIDGLTDTRLIETFVDYKISDIKSVYSNNGVSGSFTADTILNRKALIATPGTNFQITANSGGISTVSAGLGTDFIGKVAPNDIITYSLSSNETSTPIYNRVVNVSAGGNSFTIASVQSVAGVCTGSLPNSTVSVGNLTRISSKIINQDSSFLTRFKHENVSQVVLEENEVTQRRYYANVTVASNSLTLPQITDPDIYFDSFSAAKFYITYDDGTVEPLTGDKYSLDTSGTLLAFYGLTKASGTADVIATVKNLKPNSKTKKLNTATTIVVDKSNTTASGIGGTTLNDGLTYSKIYGLRVQDQDISLNVPDVVHVLAVYESNTTGEALLPRLVCSSFSGKSNSTQDYVVGEHIQGSTSGSVGLITKLTDSSTIEYISLNTKQFLPNEVITGKQSKVRCKILTKLSGDKNITQNFTLDDGQRETFYDYARLVRKPGVAAPKRALKVVFQNYTIDASDRGEFVTVNSYPQSSFKFDIPDFGNSRVTDYIDIRPRVAPYQPSSYSPFEYNARDFTQDGQSSIYTLVPRDNIILSYSYYLPRIDKVVLTPDGIFETIQGTPSDSPKIPNGKKNCLDIATIHIPPYVYDTTNVMVDMTVHKRYTMADISKLEDRIERVEEFTTLSSLEEKTKNFTIKDADTGLDRFKCGFFVDNFTTTVYEDTTNILYRACNDTTTSTLRPPHRTTSIDLQLGSSVIAGIGSTLTPDLDHTFVEDLGSPGIKKTGDLITLDYKEVIYYEQLVATRSEEITPFLVKYWAGSIQLTPQSDTWHDELSITVPKLVTNTTVNVLPDKNITVVNNVRVEQGVHFDPPNVNAGNQPFDWIANAKSVLAGYHQKSWGGADQGGLLQSSWNGSLTNVSNTNIHLVFVNRFFNKTGEDIIRKMLPKDVADGYIAKIKSGPGGLATTTIDWTPPTATTEKTTTTSAVSTTITPQTVSVKETVNKSISHYDVPIKYLRSRNIEFDAKGLRPHTRFYAFFQGINVMDYIVPKLLEVKMISGTFQVGETVNSDPHFVTHRIAFRVAAPNHKTGPYDGVSPERTVPPVYSKDGKTLITPATKIYGTTFSTNPYDQQPMPTKYTASSTFINIDTLSLTVASERGLYGSVAVGMRLIGAKSKAVAEVKSVRLISDLGGRLLGSLFVPDPNSPGNPKWVNGDNTFMLSDTVTLQEITAPLPNEIIANTIGPSESGASASFHSSAVTNVTQTDVITTRNVVITPPQKVTTTTITNTTTVSGNGSLRFGASSFDPLAESFFVEDKNGIFLTSVDIFFENKDETVPVTLQIRPMIAGVPSNTIIPFSEVTLDPKDINLSLNGSVPTRFRFKSPVYLSGSTEQSQRSAPVANQQPKEYAVVLLSGSPSHRVFITRLGEKDLITGTQVNSQPTLGSLFKSQEGSTWTPSQLEDLKFRLYRADFVNEGLVRFFNPELSYKQRQVMSTSANHFRILSKKITVGLSSNNYQLDPEVGLGVSIIQGNAVGNLVAVGGSVTQLRIRNGGGNYPPGTYSNVTLYGGETGSGLRANITVGASGTITAVSIANGGYHWYTGQELRHTSFASGAGANGRFFVAGVGATNSFSIDDIQGNFVVGLTTLSFVNSAGIQTYVGAGVTISYIDEDSVYDGLHMRILHPNHGMHSYNNIVEISQCRPTDTEAKTFTTADVTATEQTTLPIVSSAGFETFEGLPVSTTNPGYVIVGKEVIEYKSYSATSLGGLTRGIDGTSAIPYRSGVPVYQYEFHGISLRRINKKHDFAEVTGNHPRNFDSYYIKIDMDSTDFLGNTIGKNRSLGSGIERYFVDTRTTGVNGARITGNIQFESLTSQFRTLTPPSTNIDAKVRTFSATSIDGNEPSFRDQGFVDIPHNSNIVTFNTPRMICSKPNEDFFITESPGGRSLTLQYYMTTNDSRLSPVIDTEVMSVVLTSNRLNNPVGIETALSYAETQYVRDLNSDPHTFIYVSKKIALEIPANSLKVMLTAKRNKTNDVRVLYRLFRDDAPTLSNSYQLFPGYTNYTIDGLGVRRAGPAYLNTGAEDNYVAQSNNYTFKDYEYTVENLPQFTGFAIKIVMAGTDQATPPIISDLRAIATAKPQV